MSVWTNRCATFNLFRIVFGPTSVGSKVRVNWPTTFFYKKLCNFVIMFFIVSFLTEILQFFIARLCGWNVYGSCGGFSGGFCFGLLVIVRFSLNAGIESLTRRLINGIECVNNIHPGLNCRSAGAGVWTYRKLHVRPLTLHTPYRGMCVWMNDWVVADFVLGWKLNGCHEKSGRRYVLFHSQKHSTIAFVFLGMV